MLDHRLAVLDLVLHLHLGKHTDRFGDRVDQSVKQTADPTVDGVQVILLRLEPTLHAVVVGLDRIEERPQEPVP